MTIETVIAQVQRKARKYYKCIIKIGDKTFEGCDLYITELSSQFNIGDIIEMKTEIQRITGHWKYPAHYYYNALEIISINDETSQAVLDFCKSISKCDHYSDVSKCSANTILSKAESIKLYSFIDNKEKNSSDTELCF